MEQQGGQVLFASEFSVQLLPARTAVAQGASPDEGPAAAVTGFLFPVFGVDAAGI